MYIKPVYMESISIGNIWDAGNAPIKLMHICGLYTRDNGISLSVSSSTMIFVFYHYEFQNRAFNTTII